MSSYVITATARWQFFVPDVDSPEEAAEAVRTFLDSLAPTTDPGDVDLVDEVKMEFLAEEVESEDDEDGEDGEMTPPVSLLGWMAARRTG
jgi:hypothetical protein